MKKSELRQIIKEEIQKITEEVTQDEYDSATTSDRKKMLGSKFNKYANRVYNALPTSAQEFLRHGKVLKDPWKIDKPKYQSYGDKKDN